MSKHGGKREGAGRKPKADELELIEKLTPLHDLAMDALKKGLENGQYQFVQLYMIITQLKMPYVNTIWDGVVGFYDKGEYFLAFIVWFASIFIPIFKILALIWLLIMAKMGKNRFSYFSTKLYKIIEFIGKYSMLDIFVVTIMTGFLQFGNLIHVEAGGAVIPFAFVIIFTMLATQNFDTKLLWDEK
jgi:paraquat-inducible protein A